SLRPFCAKLSSCKILSVTKCPANLPYESLKNSGDAVNEYCMLGCASSVCGA
nr:crambin precursor=thionin variant Thi2Ca7 [Crambe abyssinica, seeds, Peptide Partial, 51 aa] [Crambe hispanica subsp. abyssinica]